MAYFKYPIDKIGKIQYIFANKQVIHITFYGCEKGKVVFNIDSGTKALFRFCPSTKESLHIVKKNQGTVRKGSLENPFSIPKYTILFPIFILFNSHHT